MAYKKKFKPLRGRNRMGKKRKFRGKLRVKRRGYSSPSELRIGTIHELEHAKTARIIHKGKTPKWKQKQIAKMIALDHIKEHKNYYKRLKKCGL